MDRTVEGIPTGFLRHTMGKQVWWKSDGTWVTPRAEVVREAAVIQSEMIYVGRIQVTVAQWMVMQPIF